MTVRNGKGLKASPDRATVRAFRDAVHTLPCSPGPFAGIRKRVFFLFSNRLGCLGSLAVSAILTLVLLLALDIL
jgi:hypothetical protein